MSFIFCQVSQYPLPHDLPSKAEYFLSDLKRLDKLDEKISVQIKKEINKIESKLKNKLKFDYKIVKIEEEVSERVITCSSMSNRNKDILFQATLKNPDMTEYEYQYLKQQLSKNTYGKRIISPRKEITTNKNIKMDVNTFSLKPEWTDVVEFYGGYSELGSKNINKTNWENGEYDISAKLTDIEFISETECLAIVDISGVLKLNKVPKSTYKYKGSYTVGNFNIYDIYQKRLPDIIFTFKDKKYMGKSNKFIKPINSVVDVSTDLLNTYIPSINMMFDDLISDDLYYEIDDIKLIVKNKKIKIENDRIARNLAYDKQRKKEIIDKALTKLESDYNPRRVFHKRQTEKNDPNSYKIFKGTKWTKPNFFNTTKTSSELNRELNEMLNFHRVYYNKDVKERREQEAIKQNSCNRFYGLLFIGWIASYGL